MYELKCLEMPSNVGLLTDRHDNRGEAILICLLLFTVFYTYLEQYLGQQVLVVIDILLYNVGEVP